MDAGLFRVTITAMTRRRAIILLTDQDLHHLLALEPGERVVSAWPDPMRDSIVIGIEGDDTTDLPETIEGAQASSVERPYAIAKLRDTLREIVAVHLRVEGELSDECLLAIGRRVVTEVLPSAIPSPPLAEA